MKKKSSQKKAVVLTSANQMLGSPTFFRDVQELLRRAGLPGEENAGLAAFFVAISRFRVHPLRLLIAEKTDGAAKYIVQQVSHLLLPGSTVGISPDGNVGWSRFVQAPQEKLVWISRWGAWGDQWLSAEDTYLAVEQDCLSRVVPVSRNDRVEANRTDIPAPFACITRDRSPELRKQPRWLTHKLPQQFDPGERAPLPLTDIDVQTMHEVEQLLKERAGVPIILPEWEQIIVDSMSPDRYAARHIPALLQAWKTMALVRSFIYPQNDTARLIRATFDDYAATVLFSNRLFAERHYFPSPAKLFQKIFPDDERTGLIHPLTGKAVSYAKEKKKAPWDGVTAFDFVAEEESPKK